jgi:hypothetical protein
MQEKPVRMSRKPGESQGRPLKITFGEMREMGVRGIVVYCQDYRCSHNIEVPADRWPDHMRPSDIESRFVCEACGRRGADVRPDFTRGKPLFGSTGYRNAR